ncbi:heme uptake RNA polymerase sigma-70 factor [Bordetella ansorpii]|uniref:Heme uptake RNA polymerase sigma-70 factor n=1 Tax=Bordetella ansorpii TaxID=288768 RepID=A0A157QJZ6_9BORD|nr:RNA polymerase sigma factor [Bordetella ansorpii]SAI46097.1 heme uptake RNA polymerase sigma-70 factor [Bordetella ansorpii]
MSAPSLLDYFTRRYASLKSSLTRRLGNADMASDALHDTWVRLQGMETLPERERPGAYLMRVALNIAVDGQRRETLYATGEEVESALNQHMDAAPGPARTAQARLDLGILLRQVEHMPERRRVILVMAHWEDLTREEIARRLKISVRTVDTELKRAHERLAEFFGETQK